MKETLLELLDLEQIDNNLFRGQNFVTVSGILFGGQVLSQSLTAARRTVGDDRQLHSMHAYFILAGKLDTPVIFHVDTIRDGKSFTTRRVVAVQNGTPIFNMSCSFQKVEEGFEHRDEMPEVPHHTDLITDVEWLEKNQDSVPPVMKKYMANRFFHFKPTEIINPFELKSHAPTQSIWLKCAEKLPENQAVHSEALAFVSDFNLMMTGTLPHGDQFRLDQLQTASLDHAMWLHRPFRADEWLLYDITSPSASNSRGLYLPAR
ncbi:MAG: acyl-CoA thioesterase II [Bacteroidota bacterium]